MAMDQSARALLLGDVIVSVQSLLLWIFYPACSR